MVSRTIASGLEGVAAGFARAASSTLQCHASSRIPSERASSDSDEAVSNLLAFPPDAPLGSATTSPYYQAPLRMPSQTNFMMPPPLPDGMGGSYVQRANQASQQAAYGLQGEKQGALLASMRSAANYGQAHLRDRSNAEARSSLSGVTSADAKSSISNMDLWSIPGKGQEIPITAATKPSMPRSNATTTSSTSTNTSSATAASQLSTTSTSDEDQQAVEEDQQVLDERKQKRMLSNRESARRSRLRKQQHLDGLRAQVAQLRAENSHMMSQFGAATRNYAQLTEENRVLRTHALDLSRQLQRLNEAAIAQHVGGLQSLGIEPGIFDPIRSLDHLASPSYLSSVSQPLPAFSPAHIFH